MPSKYKTLVPVDKGWAWLVMVGGLTNLYVAIAFVRSLSIIFPIFLEKYRQSAAFTTLAFGIAEIMESVANILIPIVFMPRFSVRTLCIAGAFFHAVGIGILSLLSSNLVVVNVIFGIVGFSRAFMLNTQVFIIGCYFKNRLSFANAVVAMGVSLATLTAPLATRFLLDVYNLEWTFVYIGAFSLHSIAASMLFRPMSLYANGDEVANAGQTDYKDDRDKKGSETEKEVLLTTMKEKPILTMMDKIYIHKEKEFCSSSSTVSESDDAKSINDSHQLLENNQIENSSIQNVSQQKRKAHNTSTTQATSLVKYGATATKSDRSTSEKQNALLKSSSSSSLSLTDIRSDKDLLKTNSQITATTQVHHRNSSEHISSHDTSDKKQVVSSSSSSPSSLHLRITPAIEHNNKDGNYNTQEMRYRNHGDNTDENDPDYSTGVSRLNIQSTESTSLSSESSDTDEREKEKKQCFRFKAAVRWLRGAFSRSIYSNPVALLLILASGIGVHTQSGNVYLPVLGLENGLTNDQLPLLLIITGSTDILGKFVIGLLADNCCFSPLFIVCITQTVSGVAFQLAGQYHGMIAMATLCVLYGLTAGIMHVLLPTIVVQTIGLAHLPRIVSGYYLVNCVMTFVMHIVVGSIKDVTGSFVGGFQFVGGLFLLSVLFLLAVMPVSKTVTKSHLNAEVDNQNSDG